jgi:hypothetical protein
MAWDETTGIDAIDEQLRRMGVDPARLAALPLINLMGGAQAQQRASQGPAANRKFTRAAGAPRCAFGRHSERFGATGTGYQSTGNASGQPDGRNSAQPTTAFSIRWRRAA